jgi:hypothetical protein
MEVEETINSFSKISEFSQSQERKFKLISYMACFCAALMAFTFVYFNFVLKMIHPTVPLLLVFIVFEVGFAIIAREVGKIHKTVNSITMNRMLELDKIQSNVKTQDDVMVLVDGWVGEVSSVVHSVYLLCNEDAVRMIVFCDSGASAIRKKAENLRAKLKKERPSLDFDILVLMEDNAHNYHILDEVIIGSLKYENNEWRRLL